ncbi:MAG: ATP-dependent DNA ligase [Myxococcota bacterium]
MSDPPLRPPVEPMLAKLTEAIPASGTFIFEPKWDGFRALVFKEGSDIYIQSRTKKPLARFFPELLEPMVGQLPSQVVLDGEIVLHREGRLDFEALQMRLHPARSRVDRLASETPVAFVAFDLLSHRGQDLRTKPTRDRRAQLEAVASQFRTPLYLTPATTDRSIAQRWFDRFEGAGLDGVIAKATEQSYQSKKRAMLKIKHRHDVDCVVAGFRWHKNGPGKLVGSLLLGLYEGDKLHHVGITSSFRHEQRKALAEELEPLRVQPSEAHPWREYASASSDERRPVAQSRWSQGKDLTWEPLRIERVVEVSYDHLEGHRFRHAATFRRWRLDRTPESCTYAQLQTEPPAGLATFFEAGDLTA